MNLIDSTKNDIKTCPKILDIPLDLKGVQYSYIALKVLYQKNVISFRVTSFMYDPLGSHRPPFDVMTHASLDGPSLTH